MKALISALVLALIATACSATESGLTTVEPWRTTLQGMRQTSNIEPATSTVERQTSNVDTSTSKPLFPTSTLTPTIVLSPTFTPVQCDAVKSYCVEAGHFWLDRPITLPGTIGIDRGYPYGSTQGGTREPHHGVEFYNASGTPVRAAADGVIIVAGDDSQKAYAAYPNTYGNLIVVEHHFEGIQSPIFSLYGHLSEVEVRVGQNVQQGDEIGKVGSTGVAIGSHLHFEVREGQNNYDSNRNPMLWLKPILDTLDRAGGVLAGRLEDSQGNEVRADGINIQYFPDRNGPQAAAWQVETYAPDKHPVGQDDRWRENFALADLQPGDYRISLMWGGKLYERWTVVSDGQLTFQVIRMDP